MKRVLYACIEQTIHFRLKEDAEGEVALRTVRAELEDFKSTLQRKKKNTKLLRKSIKSMGLLL